MHCGRTMASEGRDNEDGCLICLQNSEYIASLEADKKKVSHDHLHSTLIQKNVYFYFFYNQATN